MLSLSILCSMCDGGMVGIYSDFYQVEICVVCGMVGRMEITVTVSNG